MQPNYTYNVRFVEKVYDGDTITVMIDLGFDTFRIESIRLYGIDTPEIRGEERPEGLISKQYVLDKINNSYDITLRTEKDRTGKYGRYLGTFYIDGVNLNEELIEQGLAIEFMKN